ncbi:RICIN domain-containing protein [Fodinicola feengrottensis]|uniref:RICIN domain-containing protein n=1 Tax=Fodinicola feengrottensis TaxID=435914 RepID=UPI002441C92B|nr:RICIN domain-containing protein [Fodinicola feengrottensis]
MTSSNGSVVGNCGGDRSTRVQKVNWNADGTPNFGVPAASWQSMPLPSGDPGAATVATGTYRLTPQNSTSTGLDVSGCTSANATAVDIATYQGLACQQWRIRYGGNGSYTITARNSGYPLGTAGCQTARASTVDVHRAQPGDCQSWYLDPVGDGSYRVTNRLTGPGARYRRLLGRFRHPYGHLALLGGHHRHLPAVVPPTHRLIQWENPGPWIRYRPVRYVPLTTTTRSSSTRRTRRQSPSPR